MIAGLYDHIGFNPEISTSNTFVTPDVDKSVLSVDTDLDNLEVDFLLKIPNTEDNILTHGKLIYDFAYKMRGRRVDREAIAPYINTQEKERQRLAFFEEIIKKAS